MSNAKKQAEILMSELVEFAEKMLRSSGEFHPFGGYLDEAEKVVHVGLSPEVNWTSDRHRAEALSESLRALVQNKQPLVIGVVTNVSLAREGGSSDAIRVFLEHRSGYCADVFFHYRLTEGVTMTDVTAQQGVPRLFP
jgi:hypothetical protein